MLKNLNKYLINVLNEILIIRSLLEIHEFIVKKLVFFVQFISLISVKIFLFIIEYFSQLLTI
jgi:hypothetical protein